MSDDVRYPFLFDFKEVVVGKGFLAGVKILGGRALMLREDGEWWMYGVNPAGIAETGSNPTECFLNFMVGIRKVLFDFATEAPTYEDFLKGSNEFLKGLSAEDTAAWSQAQKKLKSGTVTIDTELKDMPKESPDARPFSSDVQRLDSANPTLFTPDDNVAPEMKMDRTRGNMTEEDKREWIDERAAIMEFEGHQTRENAEWAAKLLYWIGTFRGVFGKFTVDIE